MAAGVHGRARIGRSLSAARDVASLPGWVQLFVVVAVAAAIVLVALAALHDFVLGPRLAREVREGKGPRSRPLLVAVGRAALIFTFLVPILGVALTRLANG